MNIPNNEPIKEVEQMTEAVVKRLSKPIKRIVEKEKSNRFRVQLMGEMLNTEYGEEEWLVEKLIPSQAITILSGDPGHGKTWITLELAWCIATGTPFMGKFKCAQGNVLMVDEENHPRHLKKRFKLLQAPADAPIRYLTQSGVKMDNKNDVDELLKIAEEHSVKLIIVDSLIRVYNGNENESRDVAGVFEALRRFTKAGITVILTHHNRKRGIGPRDQAQSMRGSSDILGAIDCQLGIEKKDSTITIYQGKLRVDEELRPFKIELTKPAEGTVRLEYGGEVEEKETKISMAKTLILDILKDGERSRAAIVDLLKTQNIGASSVHRALVELKEEDEIVVKKIIKEDFYFLPHLTTVTSDEPEN